jgi:O-antigen/teichoic acid export membrane protein
MSYARTIKRTVQIGGASAVNALSATVRMKAAALLLGPAGVGMIGLLGSVIITLGTIVQLGMLTVGTRQIAEAHASGDIGKVAASRRALIIATFALALLGGSTTWLLRAPLAAWALGGADEHLVLFVAIGVALSTGGTAQICLVQGMQRTGEFALFSVIGSAITTAVGVPVLWAFGSVAIPVYVVLAPLVGFLTGLVMVARLPRLPAPGLDLASLVFQWAMFARLGIPFMAASVAPTAAELLIRIDVREHLGIQVLGQFQASWTLAAQYVAFLLAAMAADFFPRLTATASDSARSAMVNQQTEIALLLSGCAILGMFGWAPTVVFLLYSPEFNLTADLLRWQIVATVFQVMSWPLGFVLLAVGDGMTFFLVELASVSAMVLLAHLLLPSTGLIGVGIGYLVAQVCHLALIHGLVRSRIGFAWSPPALGTAAVLASLIGSLAAVAAAAPDWLGFVTFVAVAAFGGFGFARFHREGLTELLRKRWMEILGR